MIEQRILADVALKKPIKQSETFGVTLDFSVEPVEFRENVLDAAEKGA